MFRLWPARHPTGDVEIVATLLGLLVACAALFLPLDRFAPLAGECLFKLWTGRPCLTCGATRAVLAFAHADWRAALRMNPLVGGGLIATTLYAPLAAVMWLGRIPRPRVSPASKTAAWTSALIALVLLAANWAYLVADGR